VQKNACVIESRIPPAADLLEHVALGVERA
jgi:hypothetical protein